MCRIWAEKIVIYVKSAIYGFGTEPAISTRVVRKDVGELIFRI